ncbi:MAG: beta-phosphoglucomutase, partial [Candidatus Sumerlaeota bacterium]
MLEFGGFVFFRAALKQRSLSMIHHQIRAVLFDLDGVVVFTDKYHYLGWKKLADDMGWEFDEEINHQLRGIPRIASLEVMLRHNGVEMPMEEKKRLANQKNEYYKELLKNISADDLYPGIIDFLESLKSAGVAMGLCSSSKNAQTVLDALDLSQYFGAVVTGNDIVNAKPDPEIFLKGAKGLAIPPFHCVVFEDAESGVEAALAAGMKCIGVGKPELLPSAAETITDYADIDIEAMLDSGRTRMPPE